MVVELWLASVTTDLRPPDAQLESGISMGFQQHIHTPLCVLKARYLHRVYYTYLIHEIALECVQLYGHNSILSGVVGARWLPPRRAQLVGVAVDIAVSGIMCQYKNYN